MTEKQIPETSSGMTSFEVHRRNDEKTDSRSKFGNDENEPHCCANAPHVIAVRTLHPSLLCGARQSIVHTRLKQIPETSSGMTSFEVHSRNDGKQIPATIVAGMTGFEVHRGNDGILKCFIEITKTPKVFRLTFGVTSKTELFLCCAITIAQRSFINY